MERVLDYKSEDLSWNPDAPFILLAVGSLPHYLNSLSRHLFSYKIIMNVSAKLDIACDRTHGVKDN